MISLVLGDVILKLLTPRGVIILKLGGNSSPLISCIESVFLTLPNRR
jgi:hypothetical protein